MERYEKFSVIATGQDERETSENRNKRETRGQVMGSRKDAVKCIGGRVLYILATESVVEGWGVVIREEAWL